MEKPTKAELHKLISNYGTACANAESFKAVSNRQSYEDQIMQAQALFDQIYYHIDALYAEVPTDQATKLAECKLVTFFAAQALKRSRGHANPKRDWDTVFKSFTEAADRYSLGNETAEDRAALGLPKREVPTDAS